MTNFLRKNRGLLVATLLIPALQAWAGGRDSIAREDDRNFKSTREFEACRFFDGFANNQDGTVTDPRNGLIWQRCIVGYSWDSSTNKCTEAAPTEVDMRTAMQLARTNSFLGKSDWRLPSFQEADEVRAIHDSRDADCDKNSTCRIQRRCIKPSGFVSYDDRRVSSQILDAGNRSNSSFYSVWTYNTDTSRDHEFDRYDLDTWILKRRPYNSNEAGLDEPPGQWSVHYGTDQGYNNYSLQFVQLVRDPSGRLDSSKKWNEIVAKFDARVNRERAAAKRKSEDEEKQRKAQQAAVSNAWKKIIADGPLSMYILAGKAQRNGSVEVNGIKIGAEEIYDKLIDSYPRSEYAAKASDQLGTSRRTQSSNFESCQIQKNRCFANCPSWVSGANNDHHFDCNSKCKQITCR